jgi:hypothetical protein
MPRRRVRPKARVRIITQPAPRKWIWAGFGGGVMMGALAAVVLAGGNEEDPSAITDAELAAALPAIIEEYLAEYDDVPYGPLDTLPLDVLPEDLPLPEDPALPQDVPFDDVWLPVDEPFCCRVEDTVPGYEVYSPIEVPVPELLDIDVAATRPVEWPLEDEEPVTFMTDEPVALTAEEPVTSLYVEPDSYAESTFEPDTEPYVEPYAEPYVESYEAPVEVAEPYAVAYESVVVGESATVDGGEFTVVEAGAVDGY